MNPTLPAVVLDIVPHIKRAVGAEFVGTLASVGLLGMTTLQAYIYYNNFPQDAPWLKSLVVSMVLLDALRCSLVAYASYWVLILNWGLVVGLEIVPWSLTAHILVTSFCQVLEELYFCWRIWILTRGRTRHVLIGCLVLLVLTSLGMSIFAFITVLQSPSLASYAEGRQKIINPMALAIIAATDIAISTSLVLLLNERRTGHSTTNRVINKLIMYMIEIGALTVMGSLLCLVLNAYTSQIGFIWIGPFQITGGLYANCLLASLNARIVFRKDAEGSNLSGSRNRANSANRTNISFSVTPKNRADHPIELSNVNEWVEEEESTRTHDDKI